MNYFIYVCIFLIILGLYLTLKYKKQKNTHSKIIKDISFLCGMGYDLNDEAKIMQEIKSMPSKEITLTKMAKYADIVTKSNVNNITFLKQQLSNNSTIKKIKLKDLNLTSIGNLAIIGLKSPEPYRSRGDILFHIIIMAMKSKEPKRSETMNLFNDMMTTFK